MVAAECLETSFEDWTFGARTAKVDEQSDLQILEFGVWNLRKETGTPGKEFGVYKEYEDILALGTL